ncbi:unnamed protein product [Brassica rapa subsp. trilocularis]|uniref:Pectinesterase inhibitor domain-containing protein n=1 Tax=Brassica campestris TaxID=3711 RepID=M4DPI1_BRACM
MAGRDTSQLYVVAVVVSVTVLIFFVLGQVAEARMMNICFHMAYPSLCQPLVKRITNPRRATHRTIQALEANTKLALADAARFKKGNQAIATRRLVMQFIIWGMQEKA